MCYLLTILTYTLCVRLFLGKKEILLNIAIILGTVRTPSLTRTLARYLADCLVKRKVSPHWIDFRSIPLSDSRPR